MTDITDDPAGLPPLEVLVGPEAPRVLRPQDDAGLARLYGSTAAPTASAVVRANMIMTVDGAVRGPDQRSGSINGPADWRVFRVLRALADVVLVGAGTARAEGYGDVDVSPDVAGLRAKTGRTASPVLAVVTRAGRLPASVDRAGVLVVTCRRGARTVLNDLNSIRADDVLICGDETVDLRSAVRALAERGLMSVLCEGGPHLLGDALRAGVVDELCLTRTPVLLGTEQLGLTGSDPLDGITLHLETMLRSPGNVLVERWRVGR